MTTKMGICISETTQNRFKSNVKEEYGKIKGVYGNEVENAMKFYLAANGDKEYQDDPDVQEIFKKANQVFNTKSNESKSDTNNTIEEKIDRMEKKFEEKFEFLAKKLEQKSKRESSKKHGLAEFKKQFQMAFNDYHQVSKREVERFIMNQTDIVDKRSINNRIQYLESHGVLEPFAPNVYDVKMLNLF
jgi:hypothetical protein